MFQHKKLTPLHILAATTSLLLLSSTALANEVSLTHAQLHLDADGTSAQTIGIIAIENLADDKNVDIIYKDKDGEWNTESATYQQQTDNNLELWTFRVDTGSSVEFSIAYDVNGETFTDNNNGKNYHLDSSSNQIVSLGLSND